MHKNIVVFVSDPAKLASDLAPLEDGNKEWEGEKFLEVRYDYFVSPLELGTRNSGKVKKLATHFPSKQPKWLRPGSIDGFVDVPWKRAIAREYFNSEGKYVVRRNSEFDELYRHEMFNAFCDGLTAMLVDMHD